MNIQINLIKAHSPADLLEQIAESLQNGYDLHTQMFVSHEGLICQNVVEHSCWNEYALIVAGDLDEYERQVRKGIELGYDFFYSAILWNSQWYLQWMARYVDHPYQKRLVNLAEKQPESQPMVVAAQPAIHLAPMENGAHLVNIPYPVKFS